MISKAFLRISKAFLRISKAFLRKKSKSLENMKPIYHEDPFWAFWLIELFDKIANFGLDLRFKLEDRFTFQVDKKRKVRYGPKVYN